VLLVKLTYLFWIGIVRLCGLQHGKELISFEVHIRFSHRTGLVADGGGQIAFTYPGAPGNAAMLPLFDKIVVAKALYLVLVQWSGGPVIQGLHSGRVSEPCGLGHSFYPTVVAFVSLAWHEVGSFIAMGIAGIHSVRAQGSFKCPVHGMGAGLFYLLCRTFVHMWYLRVLIHTIFHPFCDDVRTFIGRGRCLR
jgi:hypothetical protein